MKAADLDILLQEGEGDMLEYKEGLSSTFAREVVAFANTAGTWIQDIARKNCDPPVKIPVQCTSEVTQQFTTPVGTKLALSRHQDQIHDTAHDEAYETVECTPQVPPKYPVSTPQDRGQVAGQVTGQVVPQIGTKSGLSKDQVKIIKKCLYDSNTTAGRSVHENSEKETQS